MLNLKRFFNNTIRKPVKILSKEKRVKLLKEMDHHIFAEKIKPLIKPGKKYSILVDFSYYQHYGATNKSYSIADKFVKYSKD
jgi:hypothetical protein